MICYHHNDLDGRCAAAIVKRKFPEVIMREICYKDDVLFEAELAIDKSDDPRIFIVDFSFKPEKMLELFWFRAPDHIVWIDHHKTAKDYKYHKCPVTGKHFPLSGLRDFSTPGKSGCELTWVYLFPNEPIPEAVRLLGDYDTWRFDTEERTKLFQMGLKIEDTKPSHAKFPWELLFEECESNKEVIDYYIYKGAIITGYRDSWCRDYRQSFGWEVEFEGCKCYVMNVYTLGSLGFGPEMEDQDVCIACVYSAGKWTVGLYSTKVDVSIIAKKYGGGGHKGAAGFICKELPF